LKRSKAAVLIPSFRRRNEGTLKKFRVGTVFLLSTCHSQAFLAPTRAISRGLTVLPVPPGLGSDSSEHPDDGMAGSMGLWVGGVC
jgi:hypothetical protein